MIAPIRPTPFRRALVVLTILALLAVMLPIWLYEAIARCVEEDFGEDIRKAWDGDHPAPKATGCTCPPGKSCYERCGEKETNQ